MTDSHTSKASHRTTILLVITLGLSTVACSDKHPASSEPVRVASWGGQFQEDLIQYWIKPAADECEIEIAPGSWDGNYQALTSRIQKGINNWDMVHVEAHYVEDSEALSLFMNYPDRKLANLTEELERPHAVPVLEYGYVLAFRSDLLPKPATSWNDFWNTDQLPGKRGLRDFPVGNIEIALLSFGLDLDKTLYSDSLSRQHVEEQVERALDRLTQLNDAIVWWKSGDQLQQSIVTGDTPLVAAWSGRIWAAHRELCGKNEVSQCKVKAIPSTSLVATDWWVIPKQANQASLANRLLTCMFNTTQGPIGAKEFALKQGYSVPIKGIAINDPVAQYYLELGSSSNKTPRISEEFWGKNYHWIAQRWREWRASL